MDSDTKKAIILAIVAAVGTFTVTLISLQIQKISLQKKYKSQLTKKGME